MQRDTAALKEKTAGVKGRSEAKVGMMLAPGEVVLTRIRT